MDLETALTQAACSDAQHTSIVASLLFAQKPWTNEGNWTAPVLYPSIRMVGETGPDCASVSIACSWCRLKIHPAFNTALRLKSMFEISAGTTAARLSMIFSRIRMSFEMI